MDEFDGGCFCCCSFGVLLITSELMLMLLLLLSSVYFFCWRLFSVMDSFYSSLYEYSLCDSVWWVLSISSAVGSVGWLV